MDFELANAPLPRHRPFEMLAAVGLDTIRVAPVRKYLQLRGIHATIVRPGLVRPGDAIRKL